MDNLSSLYQTKNFGNILKFYLLLGPACNMQCRHCSQSADKHSDLFDDVLNLKVWELIKNYILYSINNASTDFFVKKRKLIFWGGEALLHWKAICEIVNRTKEEFGFTVHENFRFSIISNGLLLTQDKIDYINENKIDFCFSYVFVLDTRSFC